MNIASCRIAGLLILSLVVGWLAAPAFGQTTSENPLRKARRGTPGASLRSNPVRPATHASPASAAAKPSVSPASHQQAANLKFASESRSALTPSLQPTVETSVIGQELVQGDVIYEGDIVFEGKGGDCCGGGGCFQCLSLPCPQICLDNFEVFAGVQGFTGPVNRGETGSFGFHEGFNWGAPLWCFNEIGAQLGLQATQSNLSGAEFTDQTRNQLFVTGGLFRRVDWGIQGGIVFDYLQDDWYANASLAQLRGEVSWVFPCLHEIGFWFASGTDDDVQVSTLLGGATVTETFEPIDLYAFFYRHHFDSVEGAQCRLYAGWSGDSDGLVGADFHLPLSCDWALQGGFAYLIPEQATGAAGRGHAEESWNIGMSLVWYPGARSAGGQDYYRPLFNVANNGSFMVGRR